MQILIDQYGVELSIDNHRLMIARGSTIRYLTPGRVTAIHICTPCTLTSAVLTWASQYAIPVLIYNPKGRIIARMWQTEFGSQSPRRSSNNSILRRNL